MAYLQELIAEQNRQIRQQGINSQNFFGLGPGEAYAQYFPTWEVTAPQYATPNAYSLSQLSYRTNEVAYACINLWMKTISEPSLKIYDKVSDEEVKNNEFEDFMSEPCPGVTQTDFWNAVEMYLKIAGTMAWEKNLKNNGGLLNIWPMMPQYCSYLRGEGQLMRAIRYQPYTGLPYLDVNRDRVVMFMYVDPLYYGLKPLSPTAVLSDVIGLDNNMTKMINQFLRNGAFVSGLLSTDQTIVEADAKFAKERFRQDHGGPENAGDVVVLGKGMKFERMGQTFREMVFPEVDARSETRICQGYSVKPILISAKVGMDRSTYNNYEQARQAWYDEDVTSEWVFLQKAVTRDILPHFDKNPNHECRFDIRNVRALQEDRNKREDRVVNLAKQNLITRDEARVDIGKDKIDQQPVFVGITTQQQLSEVQDVFEPGGGEDEVQQGQDTAYAENEKQKKEQLEVQKEKLKKDQEDADEEEKHFRTFAKRRLKEGKPNDIGEFEFKYVSPARQRWLMNQFNVPDPDAKMVLDALLETIKTINKPQDISIKALLPELPAPVVNNYVENKIPEQKAIEQPAPIVNVTVEPAKVNPTPIENKIEMKSPKIKKTKTASRVKRDNNFNIDGQVQETEYEYED